VLGEEFGTEGTSSRRWIVDPIDGTANYVRGNPIWATLIALEEADELRVGVVSAPALGMRWWAARGEGAFASTPSTEHHVIHVSDVSDIGEAQLCYSDIASWDEYRGSSEEFLELGRRVWRTRGIGDFWQHMLVAEGAADIATEPIVNLWDLAAVLVIVEEAGGRFTDLDGNRTAAGGTALSTNGRLHDEVLASLRLPAP
jgi:histidinol-phosphatase